MRRPRRVISGGQTGVDPAALDAAIAAGVPHGGWCRHEAYTVSNRAAVPAPEQTWTDLLRWSTLMQREACR
jgi:Circularly permutated YpsA SLOG family